MELIRWTSVLLADVSEHLTCFLVGLPACEIARTLTEESVGKCDAQTEGKSYCVDVEISPFIDDSAYRRLDYLGNSPHYRKNCHGYVAETTL